MLKIFAATIATAGALVAATPGSPVRPDYRWANASAVGAPLSLRSDRTASLADRPARGASPCLQRGGTI